MSPNGDEAFRNINDELGELAYLNRGLVIGPNGEVCLKAHEGAMSDADDFEARTGVKVMPHLRVVFLPKSSDSVLLPVLVNFDPSALETDNQAGG